jgi:hypothetical protein
MSALISRMSSQMVFTNTLLATILSPARACLPERDMTHAKAVSDKIQVVPTRILTRPLPKFHLQYDV